MVNVYFFLISFTLLGAGIKYIDDAFDEKKFNKKLAIILAPILALLWSYTMIIDQISATILLAVILGVFFEGKIDNKAHLIGFVVISSIILLIGINLMFLPLIMLIASVILDEVGNDVIEFNRGFFNEKRLCHKCFITFFDQRWLTKLTILYMVFIGLFPWYFFLAILLFDSAYLFVRMYSRSHQKPQLVAC